MISRVALVVAETDVETGLMPVRFGAGDWIDPQFFTPNDGEKAFDLVMVSSWNPFKRHVDLLRAMAQLRDLHDLRVRAALIGYPNGWGADQIRSLVAKYRLADQCEVFDSVPQTEVARIVSRSRLYILLSRREGANKAMYEAMFCDTPVLVDAAHLGINHEHILPETGAAFRRGRLPEAIRDTLSIQSFAPRAWALKHTGFKRATAALDEFLRAKAERLRQPWTRGIVEKKNEPNLRYASMDDQRALDHEYGVLAAFLRDTRS